MKPGTVKHLWKWILAIALVILFFFSTRIAFFFTEWLWYKSTGYPSVFTTVLWAQIQCGLIVGIVFFLFLIINYFLVQRFKTRFHVFLGENILQLPDFHGVEPYVKKAGILLISLVSILAGFEASTSWDMFLKAFNGAPFALSDPLFGKDIGFYVFTLPFLEYVNNHLFFLILLSLLFSVGLYIAEKNIHYSTKEFFVASKVKAHILVLLALLLSLKAWGYHLSIYKLLHSTRGVVFGAGYTDVYAVLPYLKFSIFVSIVCAGAVLSDIFSKKWKLTIVSIVVLLVLSLAGGVIYPEIMQKFIVAPNEFSKEKPFLMRNIEFTRAAFALDGITERGFSVKDDLTMQDIESNTATLKNVPLWEHKPLLQTYSELQEIRTYYNFLDVDNDRYHINGEYRQTLLSPRELSYEKLPEKNWINQTFIYTHGYGCCLGPANRVTHDGLPEFFIKDIPPSSSVEMKIDRPEIYFGELAGPYGSYCIVNSNAREFDYPLGSENKYCEYQGTGGVPIGSSLLKSLFSIRFRELKLMLSSDINSGSKIMFYRNINERVRKVTPFIYYDDDPYMIISKGRLHWILDGYTATNRYPYSEPINKRGGGNYLRNSVKAVVDAYDGTMKFYISDDADPILATYSKIFPTVFKPMSEMPEDIKAHIRYPTGLFNVQAYMYAIYHMTDPQVFYNKEDLWKIPRQVAAGHEEEDMRPYYTILRFPEPEGEKEEFILMIPFTPSRKQNMIAWMAARCDPPHYGKILVYAFPKEKLIYGPLQINARIDQDPEISKQLSLWGQGGSEVVRGSLLVIPIKESLLYIEPLYLAAEKGKLPQLKKVLVIYGSTVVMEDNLEEAIKKVFGARIEEAPPREGAISRTKEERIKALVLEMNNHFLQARKYQSEDDWAGYGDEMKRVQRCLDQLVTIYRSDDKGMKSEKSDAVEKKEMNRREEIKETKVEKAEPGEK